MKSKTKLTFSGWILLGLLLFFMLSSGLLVKLVCLVLILIAFRLIFSALPSRKEYSNTEAKRKTNLPPALAEKLSKRDNE